MSNGCRGLLALAVALALLPPLTAAAEGQLEVSEVGWETQGNLVSFHVQFHNAGTTPTEPAAGEIRPQEYGAFVPVIGTIGSFDVPPIEPESFFDVFFTVPLASLPPSAVKTTPWDKSAAAVCGPDDHWDGNVDIIWAFGGGGGGHVNAHFGHLLVCPGFGNSFIHVVTGCPGWIAWAFQGVCAGWTVSLLNEDRTPAPQPLPPGWTGWIGVSVNASVPVGTICCFALNLTCNNVTVPVRLCAEACDCSPVPVEPTTWGAVKSLYN